MNAMRTWWTIQGRRYSLGFILVLALLLRLPGIKDRDFWFDEAFTGITIRETWEGMMRIIIADTHPPLYYFLLKPFASITDYSVLGIRLFSLVWGIVCVYTIYKIAQTLFVERAARYAALLAALSPFTIYYSQEARSYTMLAGLLLIAFYYFILAIRTHRMKYYILWGIASGMAALTHYMALIAIALFAIAYGLFLLKDKKRKILAELRGIGIGYGIQCLMFLPWLPYFLHQFRHRTNLIGWIEPATFSYLVETVSIFIWGNPKGELGMGMPQLNILYGIPRPATIVITTLLIAAAGIFFIIKESKYRYLILFPSIGYILTIFALTFFDLHYVIPRYLIGAACFLYILLGAVLSHLSVRTARSILLGYIAALFLIVPMQNSNGYNALFAEKDMFSDSTFYVLNTYDYVIAKYYFGYDAVALYNIDLPTYNPSGWLGVNGSLKRTESVADITLQSNAVILWNTHSHIQTDWEKFAQENDLHVIKTYNNLYLYMPSK